MIEQIAVDHFTVITSRPFDEVASAFESWIGSADERGMSSIAENATNKTDFEKRVITTLGPSDFTRFTISSQDGAEVHEAALRLDEDARLFGVVRRCQLRPDGTTPRPLVSQTFHAKGLTEFRSLRFWYMPMYAVPISFNFLEI
jgi:hypothetical protein